MPLKSVAVLMLSFLLLGSVETAFAFSSIPSAPAQSSTTNSLPYYSTTYSTQRQAAASLLESLYNTTYSLTMGTNVDCGHQPNGFSLIDANLFAGRALQQYNQSMGNAIIASVDSYLAQVNYQHNDRREVLFGNPVPYPPLKTYQQTVTGIRPICPNGGKNESKFFITTEFPNASAPQTKLDAMNYLVAAGLQKFQTGDVATAQSLFNTAVGWWTWNSTYHGFLSPAQLPCPPNNPNCNSGDSFNTRELAYFLFFERATRFSVSPTILSEIESTLWTQQTASFGGGLATAYNYDGTPFMTKGHTSNEINGLALLAYDARIQTTWWPGQVQTLPTNTTVSCDPSSVMVKMATTCEATVSNNDNSTALLPTGSVGFSNGAGSFSQGGSCVLSKIDSTKEGCSVTFAPNTGSEGGQTITANYTGDTYHAISTGTFALTVIPLRSTSTALTCTPGSVQVDVQSSCGVTVTDTDSGSAITPTGIVSFSSSGSGTFSPTTCTLGQTSPGVGGCSVNYTPTSVGTGTHSITASYPGDSAHTISSGPFSLTVTSPVTSTVTFTESGLPSGTSWSVTFNGQNYPSTTSAITINNVAQTRYSWTAQSPISGGSGIRYAAAPLSGTMSVPSQTTQNVIYTKQYQITMSVTPSSTAGTALPSGTVWVNAASALPISASPSTGYVFGSWTKSSSSILLSSTASPATTATINGPGTITARFLASLSLSLSSGSGSVATGNSISTVLTITGGSQSVTLSVTGRPSHVTFSWTSNPITDSTSGVHDTLTIRVSSKAAHGTYTLNVTATGADGKTSTAVYTLTIA